MLKQIEEITKKIVGIEQEFHKTKEVMFITKEALKVSQDKLNILKGKQQAFIEIKESLEKALEEKKPKK